MFDHAQGIMAKSIMGSGNGNGNGTRSQRRFARVCSHSLEDKHASTKLAGVVHKYTSIATARILLYEQDKGR